MWYVIKQIVECINCGEPDCNKTTDSSSQTTTESEEGSVSDDGYIYNWGHELLFTVLIISFCFAFV